MRFSACAEPDSGITGAAVILFVAKETDPCFRIRLRRTVKIEPFFVTVELQRGL